MILMLFGIGVKLEEVVSLRIDTLTASAVLMYDHVATVYFYVFFN